MGYVEMGRDGKKIKEVMSILEDAKRPLTTSEILDKLNKNSLKVLKDKSVRNSKLRQKQLIKLEEAGKIFRIQRSDIYKNKFIKKFNLSWNKSAHSYYIATNSETTKLRQLFDKFLAIFKDYLSDAKKIKNLLNEICKKISRFEALNYYEKARPFIACKDKKGKITQFKVKHPISMLSFGDDESVIQIFNKIYDKISKWDSPEMASLSAEISNEIDELRKILLKEFSPMSILNKIEIKINKKDGAK